MTWTNGLQCQEEQIPWEYSDMAMVAQKMQELSNAEWWNQCRCTGIDAHIHPNTYHRHSLAVQQVPHDLMTPNCIAG